MLVCVCVCVCACACVCARALAHACKLGEAEGKEFHCRGLEKKGTKAQKKEFFAGP